MRLLIATDLPVPVAPAMSRCGILARSATIGLPSMSRPSTSGSMPREPSHSGDSSSSRSVTMRALGFGTSTPTAPLPGIGATRIDGARIAMARSSASATMRWAFTPGAGTTSNCVTTGPVVRPAMVPSTLKVRSVSSSKAPRRSSCVSLRSVSCGAAGVRSSIGGSSSSSVMLAAVSFGAGFGFLSFFGAGSPPGPAAQ